jgi:hypothetical protein
LYKISKFNILKKGLELIYPNRNVGSDEGESFNCCKYFRIYSSTTFPPIKMNEIKCKNLLDIVLNAWVRGFAAMQSYSL